MLNKFKKNNVINLFLISLILLILLLSIFFVKYYNSKKNPVLTKCNVDTSLVELESINDDFKLINEEGDIITREQLFDIPSLIYFGYTYCPDICPFDLLRNSQVVESLENDGLKIKPIFITLDPKRDTLQILKEYTDFHHREMIGLTGSEKEIQKVQDIFMVYSQFPNDLTGDYILNHSTFTYFVLPNKGLQTYFTRRDNVDEISEKIRCIIQEHNMLK